MLPIYEILKVDHRMVLNIIDTIEQSDSADRRKHLITLAHTELAMHSKAEEEVFYRPLREQTGDDALLTHSFQEHDAIDLLLGKLQGGSGEGADWMRDLRELKKVLEAHIALEEGAVFKLAEENFSAADAMEIGARMLEEKSRFAMPNPINVAARKIKEILHGDNRKAS